MRIRLFDPAVHPRFDDFAWDRPLEDWTDPRLVDLPAGLHRHVVRFVEVSGQYYALKELPERLAQREQPEAHGLDLCFQKVDRSISFAHPLSERLIPPMHGTDGCFALTFDKAAHLGDLGFEGSKFLVERADYVVVCTH